MEILALQNFTNCATEFGKICRGKTGRDDTVIVAVVTEAPIYRRVSASLSNDLLRVCWSSTLETAAVEEGVPALVDGLPFRIPHLLSYAALRRCLDPEYSDPLRSVAIIPLIDLQDY